MSLRENKVQRPDWLTILLFAGMVLFGWTMIVAVEYRDDSFSLFDMASQHGKQLLFIPSAALLALLILLLDYRFIETFAYPLYGVMLLLLAVTIVIAAEVKGARSWIHIGSFTVQPAEFAKAATALALAKYLTQLQVNMKQLRTRLISLAIIMVPVALIILQKDTGSAIVFLSLILVLYREGFPVTLPLIGLYTGALFALTIKYEPVPVLIGLLIVYAVLMGLMAFNMKANKLRMLLMTVILLASVAFSFFAVDAVFSGVLQPHQQVRINVLLGKEYSAGADYNVMQSKIAIGSGGWSGKGYLQGTMTKGEFVPEQSTDFIFTTVGEELGFVGSALFVAFFIAFLLRIIFLAERQRSHFSRVYGYGVASILFAHFVVNIGMTIGVLPVVGIPLPFISYGGSSLWGFTILIFLLLKLDANRKLVLR